jgi:hypothetical protein
MTIGELVGKILGEGNGDMMRRIVEQMLTVINRLFTLNETKDSLTHLEIGRARGKDDFRGR